MRRTISIFTTTMMFLVPSTALALATWTVDATTSDGSPLDAVTQGAQVILDITLRTTDFGLGLAGSVNDYDPSVVTLNAAESAISESILVGIGTGPGTGLGGLFNIHSAGGGAPFAEQEVFVGLGNPVFVGYESEFFGGIRLTPTAGNGSLDQGIVTGTAGDPQFRIVMDVVGAPGDTTTMNVGTYVRYLDAYCGNVDCEFGVSNSINTSVSITIVPEPSTALLIGLGLAGLGMRRTATRPVV